MFALKILRGKLFTRVPNLFLIGAHLLVAGGLQKFIHKGERRWRFGLKVR